MGNKSGGMVIDKLSMAYAVTSMQYSSRQIDKERVEVQNLKRQLIEDSECLAGDRAETYKEILDQITAFVNKVADAALMLRNEAARRNERFNLEVDFRKIDAKAQESLTQTKATRAKKLKGI